MSRPANLTPAGVAEVEVRDGGIPRYQLSHWWEELGLIAGVTARGAGLDFRLDQTVESLPKRWTRLGESLGGRFRWLVVGRQEHTANIAVHRQFDQPVVSVVPSTDGHVTRLRGVLLLATVADCIPVYLAHPPSSTLALLHAGWRGIARGILETGVEHCLKLAEASPGELIMHCGIGICGRCYEVGHEVLAALGIDPAAGRYLDLREVLSQRAAALGIGRVTVSTWCTAHDGERFYSHRAQGPKAGRMVAYLGLPEPF
jgi:YfiH family protein